MNQVRKKDAIEAEWLRNYTLIRNLYLSDMSLNDLVYWLGIFENFTVTLKSQLEYRLKKWNILKNIDRDSWKHIDKTITKRKLEGKESDVLLSGKRVKRSTIEKETNRHRNTIIAAQNLPGSRAQPTASSDQIIICTPQPYINEFEWPETLPWFKFRSKLQEWLSYTKLHRIASEQREPVLDLLMSKILLVRHELDHIQASHLVPRLAMNLAIGMPEYFPGEHLQTAQIIATGTIKVMMPECLKLIFYKVSNNKAVRWYGDDFENLYTILSRTGLLGAIENLKRARQQDLTIRAFMDNLFKALIIFICSGNRMVNMENPKSLVKWLLSLGQDPNISIESPHLWSIFTALEHTILSRQVDIMESLLKAGAVISRNRRGSRLRSTMSYVLPDRSCDNEGAHIIRLLVGHYKVLTAEEVLHAAILLHDERLFEQALSIGADISLPIETLTVEKLSFTKTNVVKEETALSTAAAVSLHATTLVFDLLRKQGQAIEAASYITPDVFISAACAGNTDVISFLHEINPIGFQRNARGVTPLEVAIKHGHQEAYQLLFQLYRQSSATLLLIPLFTHQLAISQYLLANGFDVNLTAKQADIDACWVLVPSWLHDDFGIYNNGKPPTVLELFLCFIPFKENWEDGIALLVKSGAIFPTEAILELSSAGYSDTLSAALDAGGNPNIKDSNGSSALALALERKNTDCVQLLLEMGAELQTSISEVFEAFTPEHVRNIQGEGGGCDPRLRALLLEHWANTFDITEDSELVIDAAIITQDTASLKSAFSQLPTYYSPSSLCCAVLVENHGVIDFLLNNRSLQAHYDILEGTAVGLAAMLGDLPLVRKLVAQLQRPEAALLPFYATDSSFTFSYDNGLCITQSQIFWHVTFNDDGDYDGLDRLSQGSPLALAASYRGTAGILELLSHGYQPDDITWARAFSTDNPDCLEALMDYNIRVRSLQLPLLTLSPLLTYAIRHGMEEAVFWLIEIGADVNGNDIFEEMDRSPLQLATGCGHLTIAERLLRSGAKVNAAPSFFVGVTALQIAAIQGRIGLAMQLLDAGARVNARGSRRRGRTALEGAAEHGRLDMVELLLHHGALATGPGRFQFIRAIHFAEREGHQATAVLLRKSREWTDEDTHIYDPMCADCGYYFSEPRPSGKGCHACNNGSTPGPYCCDEIHTPEDDCYHCYTEDEENRWGLKIQQEEERKFEEESESQEDMELEEGIESADDN
ncbi:Sex-determining fem-1 [Fusarium pseudoanthophilum]|uniref:Sex-determining fem-1 n=1 Tax=Fusarium pseudoanthophilum TaxID=48495 RepID=A0A8H5KRN3_9HYPO|nr:Sex-determining fem-1 [Fusarium pseudoanthophilum]